MSLAKEAGQQRKVMEQNVEQMGHPVKRVFFIEIRVYDFNMKFS